MRHSPLALFVSTSCQLPSSGRVLLIGPESFLMRSLFWGRVTVGMRESVPSAISRLGVRARARAKEQKRLRSSSERNIKGDTFCGGVDVVGGPKKSLDPSTFRCFALVRRMRRTHRRVLTSRKETARALDALSKPSISCRARSNVFLFVRVVFLLSPKLAPLPSVRPRASRECHESHFFLALLLRSS